MNTQLKIVFEDGLGTFSSIAHNIELLRLPCIGEEIMFPYDPNMKQSPLLDDVQKATKTDIFKVVNVTHALTHKMPTAYIFVTPVILRNRN